MSRFEYLDFALFRLLVEILAYFFGDDKNHTIISRMAWLYYMSV